jgi:hypothetical protein
VHANYFSSYLESRDLISYLLKETDQRLVFERVFFFALIWSFGSVLAGSSRLVFDNLLKSAMEKNKSHCQFPPGKSCFDYPPDFANNLWTAWYDGVTGLDMAAENAIELQLIPTNENAAMIYASRQLVTMRYVLDPAVYDDRLLLLSNCSTLSSVLQVLRSFLHRQERVVGPMPNISLDNI